MVVLMAIFYGLAIISLLIVTAMRPQRTTMSQFELSRRAELGDRQAKKLIHREKLLIDILTIKQVLTALLLVIISALSVFLFHWLMGILLALLIALEYGAVARLPLLQRFCDQLYSRYESKLLSLAERNAKIFAIMRVAVPMSVGDAGLGSREELLHLINHSDDMLSASERSLISHALEFEAIPVSQVMTPRSMISTIAKKELLGPLVLDDLHKTGHSRFPVIDKDIDHIIGLVYIHDLIRLDNKRSLTAEKAMDPKVYYIRDDQTLPEALAAFIKTHHHLFIVINEFRETVGVLSLEDVMEALLGREIVDEFDTHDDLRAVAERNLGRINRPRQHQDV